MAPRKAISKRVRFEVMKRDSFTCQYCGKSAPEVILHIDHIKPVSKGGNNGILNLVTSCQSCNLGKSNIELSDDSAVIKQQSQLKLMAEKNEQIKMMIEWRESIINAEELLVDSVVSRVNALMISRTLNDMGAMTVRKAVKKHGYQLVIDCIEKTYENSVDLEYFQLNYSKGLPYIGKISTEESKSISYIKGILRNRFNNFNQSRFYAEIGKYKLTKSEIESATESAKDVSVISDFYYHLETLTNG